MHQYKVVCSLKTLLLFLSIFLFFVITILISSPVFAVNLVDSTPWLNSNTIYANTSAVATCTGPTFGSMNDGICDSWKVNSGTKHGLYINFTDSRHGVNVRYNYS